MKRVDFEIEELAVHGLSVPEVDAFVAALRAELAAGLVPAAVRGELATRGEIDVPGPSRPVQLSAPVEPSALGRSTARIVTQELLP